MSVSLGNDSSDEALALLSHLRGAYADELMDNPPVHIFDPSIVGEIRAEESARKFASQDIDRFLLAAKRKGIVVQLTREVKS